MAEPFRVPRRTVYRLVAVVVLGILAGCSAPFVGEGPPDDRVCTGVGCVSPSRLARGVQEQLDGRVVGYVALVGDAVLAGGDARKDSDPPRQSMSADTVVNTASVGKMFTTVAVLTTLARHGLGVDTAIGPYLPEGWVRGPGVASVTFRELLTHRSGFRLDSSRVFTDDSAAREQIAAGVTPSDRAFAEYNNINFSIMRDLLPRVDQAVGVSPDRWFLDRIRNDVFDRVGVRDASCSVPVTPMLYYPAPAPGAATGHVPPAGPAACSAGGWFMTPADMLRVLRGLEDATILGAEAERVMDQGCLGWDYCDPSSNSYWKLGGYGEQHAGFGTFLGTVAGIPVMIVANSPANSPGTQDLESAVITARATATSPAR
jgi:CubicO group peptidase (beta-lactamase class C family)